jgi:homocysteine S-methyltransferase
MGENRFLRALQDGVILGDGAYGTELLRRGSLAGRPLDELNLTRPHLVLALHQEYRAAGSTLTKTNTFLANGFRLTEHGLSDRVKDLNAAGVRLAREAAREGLVAGVVGPLTECPWKDRTGFYREQVAVLAEEGCDVLLLETFMEASDLLAALEVSSKTGLPVIGQMALTLDRGFDRLCTVPVQSGLTVLGTNCVDPEQALRSIQRASKGANRPLSAFPSAGMPGEEKSPAEFADVLVEIVEAGARVIGGCCGTGPDHIRSVAGRIRKAR